MIAVSCAPLACTGAANAGVNATTSNGATTEGREPAVVELPPAARRGELSLEAALASRASVRTYGARSLTQEELSQLLWAADGTNREDGRRTTPSAGATYPLEIYVVTAEQLLHYIPDGHRVAVLADEDLLAPMRATAQEFIADGAALFVITADFERTERKYGALAERFVHLEAGHAAQNILLQAVALGLGAVPVGGFDEAAVRSTLQLPEEHAPLYLVPVGEPR